jgi:hypothetical protein
MLLAEKNQHESDRSELKKDCSENKKDARILGERFGVINPQRRDRGREEKERDNEALGRLRLRTAENQEREPADERREDDDLYEAGVFEAVEELVASPTAPLLFGSETAAKKASAS